MPSIITITFNPAIDKSTSVEKIAPEKKLRCTAPKFEPGGGGINVARAIKKLGGDATAIYPAGGHTGIFFNKLLHEEQVKTSDIKTVSYTRENLIVRNEATNEQFRFGMPGSPLVEEEWKECLEVIKKMSGVEIIVASGSLPPGVPKNIFAEIAMIAKDRKAKLIVDTSGDALKYVAEKGTFLLKPNLGELSTLVGKDYIEPAEIEDHARDIIRKGFCEILIVSMGEMGAMLVTKDEIHRVTPPVVERKSTVGAGDSLVAGIVMGLSAKKSLREMLMYGVAAGTAATMNAGTGLCRLEDVTRIYNSLTSNP